MSFVAQLRSRARAARIRDALWVRLIDGGRLLLTGEGRARVWTRLVHADELQQTAPYTWTERYPEIFDLAAKLMPDAVRVLSFGCSTGEELISLRRRFPCAEIVGAEINPRSRAIARQQVAGDERSIVVPPHMIFGSFDVIFALSVLQRDPRGIADKVGEKKLAARYPFERFNAALSGLATSVRQGGLLCVANALYRVEDSLAAGELEPMSCSPTMHRTLLGPDGVRLRDATARTVFRKL